MTGFVLGLALITSPVPCGQVPRGQISIFYRPENRPPVPRGQISIFYHRENRDLTPRAGAGAGAGMSPGAASRRAVVDFDVPYDSDVVRREPTPRRTTARAQTSKPKKFSPTDRVIAVAAGVAVGWVVGGAIGFKVTSTSNPYDDTSGLKGVIIGAPIGGAAGGILGYWLTNR